MGYHKNAAVLCCSERSRDEIAGAGHPSQAVAANSGQRLSAGSNSRNIKCRDLGENKSLKKRGAWHCWKRMR